MKALIGAASVVVILAAMRAASDLLIPLVIALFLALISFPLVRWLEARRIPRAVAVTATVVAVLATLAGPGLLIAATVRQFANAVPGYEARLRQLGAGVTGWLESHNVDTTPLATFVDPARVLGLMVNALSGVVTLVSVGFLVALVAAFMLVEAARLLDERRVVLPDGSRRNLIRIVGELQVYLRVKTAVSLATGMAAGAWVGALGVDFALLWGLTAFLLNYIPTLGSIAAAFPPVLLAIIQFGPGLAVVVALGYLGINLLFAYIIEPQMMGRRLGLSPLVVLLSVIVWGWVWGMAGALLSVPITMAIKIGFESSPELRWVSRLLGGGSDSRR